MAYNVRTIPHPVAGNPPSRAYVPAAWIPRNTVPTCNSTATMADARSSTSQPRHHLFLCGVGRSGTTILRRSLGLHQEIYYEGKENNLIQDVLTVARDNCTLASRKFAMTVDQATYDAAFRRLVQDLVWPDPQGREKPVWMAAINPTEDLMDYLCREFWPSCETASKSSRRECNIAPSASSISNRTAGRGLAPVASSNGPNATPSNFSCCVTSGFTTKTDWNRRSGNCSAGWDCLLKNRS